MNEKDYKEIAEIINSVEYDLVQDKIDLVKKFAHHFEKKDKGYYDHYKQKTIEGFNRKQFLKDCGVE